MHQCPFCHSEERILISNETAYVLLSNPLKVENHLLVIPKRHVELPWELTDTERTDIFTLVNQLQPKLVALYGGCDLRQHCRPFMKESRLTVRHVHYHLVPRSLHDAIYTNVEYAETDMFHEATLAEHDAAQRLVGS